MRESGPPGRIHDPQMGDKNAKLGSLGNVDTEGSGRARITFTGKN